MVFAYEQDDEYGDRSRRRVAVVAVCVKGRVRPVTSLVAGVAKCAHCNGSVIRVSKGEYVYLICSRAHAKAGCKYQAVQYHDVEDALRQNIDALIDEAPLGNSTEGLEEEIVARDFQLSDMRDDAQALLREFRETRSPTIRQALRRAERDIEARSQASRTERPARAFGNPVRDPPPQCSP